MTAQKIGKIIIPSGRRVWPHEMHVAKILAAAGHEVEFLPEVGPAPADIRIDKRIIYEIKSPESFNANSLKHTIDRGLKQSPNIIIDSSRIKLNVDQKIILFLTNYPRRQKHIRKLLFINKKKDIVVIFEKK